MLELFPTIDVLTVQETTRKAELEATIERGLQTFVEVGLALMEIRDTGLYKPAQTFEEYCRERWGMERRHAYRLIDAAAVVENVSQGTQIEAPASERQARPLTPLTPDLQREAWREAVDTAPNGKVTAAHVQAVVDRMTEPEPEEEEKPDIYDLNIWCSMCIHCRTVDSDQDLDFCKKYDKTIYPIGSMYGDLYGDAGQAATCPGYQEDEPEPRAMAHVGQNSGNNEWYTPAEYIEAARDVMGAIDLDPASTEVANAIVGASKFYTADDNGLLYDWRGKVFMNPPYAQPAIADFCAKMREEFIAERVTEAIVLVNNATETAWFQSLISAATAVCFPLARVKFWSPDRVAAPLQGQAVVYLGANFDAFIARFMAFGWCAEVA